MKRWLLVATVFLAVALLYSFGALELLERGRVDLEFRLAAREARSGVVVVEIDPKSLDALGVWPWPRGYHATVLERLRDAGARRVGFDIDFSSRSVAGEDAALAGALAAGGRDVVLPVFLQWQETKSGNPRRVISQPLPEFARHATLASINVRPESDGLVRRYENRTHFEDRSFPAFATALAGDPHPELDSFYLDYGISSRSIPRISYLDVLTDQFDPSRVRDRVVVVGATAVELGDQIAVPIAAALPGILLQAIAFESLEQDRCLVRASPVLTLAIALLGALLIAPFLARRSWRGGLVWTAVSSVGALGLAWVVEQLWPVLLDATPWVLITVGVYGSSLIVRVDQLALGMLRQRAANRRTESMMRHVVRNSFDAIITLDTVGAIETFNRSAEAMFGYSVSEARGLRLSELLAPTEVRSHQSLLARAIEKPTEAFGWSRAGRRFPVELAVNSIDVDDDPKLVAMIRDITERKAHQEELKHRATHDPLTDLPNRVLLRERIERALEDPTQVDRPAALLLGDLDRFKEINDALGHGVGDRLLQEVAKRLAGPLREEDTLARLGGDEFAVFLPQTSGEGVRRVAEQLIEALRAPFCVGGFSLEVDTSLGIVLYPDHGTDPDRLLQRADVAMYVAKRTRSGLAFYTPEQDSNRIRQLNIKGELRNAIEQGQLRLVFQPKVLHATDRVVGVEALLRWTHPEHGFIPPDEIARVAEHSGLIRPLTGWVMETAIDQAARWRREGFPLGISVNVSARNLTEDDLPLRCETLVRRHGLAPPDLTLEITESAIMDDPERALGTMQRLRELGLGIAVDDFGTGYSSLAYLLRLPATELKIDKSFVMRLDADAGSATIVRSTIDLAHKLGMLVVAEGVETEAIWNTLKQLGCDIGQGYHFSRPVPADELLEFARRGPGATAIPSVPAGAGNPAESIGC